MPLPEIIPSNLPQFVQLKNRSSFTNSVIPSGAVLLFAESDGNGGSKLIAKNPDGSFSEVGGGSSMNFYKCASVGTGTWTGYLASVDSTTGVWSFAETATTGLTYDRRTPVVGKVYDEECTFMVSGYKTGLPEDYVFYASLNGSTPGTAESGQTLTTTGTISHSEYHGIPCAVCSSARLMTTFPVANGSPFTYSFWASFDVPNGYIFSIGDSNGRLMFGDDRTMYYASTYTFTSGYAEPTPTFQHYLLTYNGVTLSLYNNGQLITDVTTNTIYSSTDFALCGLTYISSSQYQYTGYTAAHRVYNRALSASEISALANEFTPTAS